MAPIGRKDAIIVPITIFNCMTPEPINPGKNKRKNFFNFYQSAGYEYDDK